MAISANSCSQISENMAKWEEAHAAAKTLLITDPCINYMIAIAPKRNSGT